LCSANPHISAETGFAQGFQEKKHPWSPDLRSEAYRIVQRKIAPSDQSSELPAKIRAGKIGPWDIKASGELAGKSLLKWLGRIDREKPFFAFLNYMEAHRPWVPPVEYRRRVLSEDEVERSYEVNRSLTKLWRYTFGVESYTNDELEIMAGRYEATIAELDDLLRDLIETLDAEGFLENTVVVVTSDHGEHLCEKNLLDHQYSLYEPLLRVPLVLYYPKRIDPGRESGPVMTHDLFRTLHELAAVGLPAALAERGTSLLAPDVERERVCECLGVFSSPYPTVLAFSPHWDPTPWEREIRAVYLDSLKLIRWSDGEERLFRIEKDPEEKEDVAEELEEEKDRLEEALAAWAAALDEAEPSKGPGPVFTEAQRGMLEALGYLHDGREDEETAGVPEDTAAPDERDRNGGKAAVSIEERDE